MFRILAVVLLSASSLGLSQTITSTQYHSDLSKSFCLINSVRDANKGFFGRIHRLKVQYDTTDQYGNEITATGLIAFDSRVSRDPATMLFLHPTSSTKQHVPSNKSFDVNYTACKTVNRNLILIAPDLEGLGEGEGPHSFLIKSQTVSASLDLLVAARKHLAENFGINLRPDLILSGYSQGSHGSLAIQQALETGYPLDYFKTSFNLAMSPPTNLSTVLFDSLVLEPNEDAAHFAILILVNFQHFYGDVYYDASSAIRQEYLNVVPLALDFNSRELNRIVPSPEKILIPQYFNEIAENTDHPFRKRLQENDIQPWETKTKIYLGYSKGDEIVIPSDTYKFYREMKALGSKIELRETSSRARHTVNFLKAVHDMVHILRNEGHL